MRLAANMLLVERSPPDRHLPGSTFAIYTPSNFSMTMKTLSQSVIGVYNANLKSSLTDASS